MPPPHSSSSSSSSSLFNPYSANLKKRRKSDFILSIVAITIIIIYFIFNTTGHYQLQQILHQQQKQEQEQQQQYHDVIINNRHEPKSSTSDIKVGMNHHEHKNTYNDQQQPNKQSSFIPTLRNKKIFFEVVTVGLKQYSYLEDIIDAVRDMCEAGAHVSFHITSSNCNPKGGKEGEEDECPIRNQSSEETKEDNFNVETISHLNERVRCRNPEGKLEMSIHLVSPDWG